MSTMITIAIYSSFLVLFLYLPFVITWESLEKAFALPKEIIEPLTLPAGHVSRDIISLILSAVLFVSFIIYGIRKKLMKIKKQYGLISKTTLPSKVYEGDSHSVTLTFEPNAITSQRSLIEKFNVDIYEFEESRILRSKRPASFLEVELLAAGFNIDGQKQQRKEITKTSLSYHWVCYFPNSGNHTVTLIFRYIDPYYSITEIETIKHKIKVVTLDHMTKRQVLVLAWLSGILSAGVATAQAFHKLGLW